MKNPEPNSELQNLQKKKQQQNQSNLDKFHLNLL